MRLAGSASLSSSNVAGSGILVKTYSFRDAAAAPSKWDDTAASHARIIAKFPGQPSDPAYFLDGLMGPFHAEFSGVVVFGSPGSYALALHCAGLCRLYIYGAPSLACCSRRTLLGLAARALCRQQISKQRSFIQVRLWQRPRQTSHS